MFQNQPGNKTLGFELSNCKISQTVRKLDTDKAITDCVCFYYSRSVRTLLKH